MKNSFYFLSLLLTLLCQLNGYGQSNQVVLEQVQMYSSIRPDGKYWQASKEQVEKFAAFYNLDKNKLITSWLSDQIANTILYEENIGEVLKVAEEKAIYLKTIHDGK